jgi:CRP-like cAMP-binding protein
VSITKKLSRCDLFEHFDDARLESLASSANLRRFSVNDRIFELGSPCSSLYLVLKGVVRLQRNTPFGLFTVANIGAGELFGDRSFSDRSEHTCEAIAETKVELVRFDGKQIDALSDAELSFATAFYWALWKSLSRKLRTINNDLAEFFGRKESPPDAEQPDSDIAPRTAFRLDMAAKEDLFQEQRLTPMEINFLASLSREENYAPAETIFNEGETGDTMYVVLNGTVMISKFIPGGGIEALAFLERGNYFGEMAVLDHLPRSAGAKADTEGAVVLAISRNVAEAVLDSRKISSIRLLRLLCTMATQRLRNSDQKFLGWHQLSVGSTD